MLSGCELIDTENISLPSAERHWQAKLVNPIADFDVCNKKKTNEYYH
jgi:hypothetical protein